MKNTLKPFFKNNKALFLAYDHGFEHGPKDLIGLGTRPEAIVDLALRGGYTGLILQKGLAEHYYSRKVQTKQLSLIIKLNGKTNLLTEEPYAALNCSVAYAKKLGAQAVGYTIYLGSEKEAQMFEDFGKVEEEAHRLGLAVMVWMYPRGKKVTPELLPQLTLYGVRLGLELGADLIKIKDPGSFELLKQTVELAGDSKIILSGGEKIAEEEFLDLVRKSVKAGVAGLAVGRNIWQRENPFVITEEIKKILWN
ncbi:MAG: fructose-bisphosphate aldolase, class [Patescibacteria group bacterium]|nr:fructose-bisphosphate aldolase, class [Patescibacteria group bacterium]